MPIPILTAIGINGMIDLKYHKTRAIIKIADKIQIKLISKIEWLLA